MTEVQKIFRKFQRRVSREGYSPKLLAWLKTQKQRLSKPHFSALIQRVLLFLKNHREVIHTPTWYGEYVSYTENYSALRSWVDETCETATTTNTVDSQSSWFSSAWEILFSPLTIRLAITFLLLRTAQAQRPIDTSLVGKPNHTDIFRIPLFSTEIQGWENEWTAHAGTQSVFDQLDLSAIWKEGEEIKVSFQKMGNDTRLVISDGGYFKNVLLTFVNTPLMNFCFPGIDPLKFIIPHLKLRHSDFCDCRKPFELSSIPNTPFVNLTGYEAIPFNQAISHVYSPYKDQKTSVGFQHVEFKITGNIRREFFSVPMSNYLKQNPVTVYHVTSETKEMALTLPAYNASAQQTPAVVLFDLPEPNLLMFATKATKDRLVVNTGEKEMTFTGKNLEWLCRDNPPLALSLLHNTFQPTFIDCTDLENWSYSTKYLFAEAQKLVEEHRNREDHFIKFTTPTEEQTCSKKTNILNPTLYSPKLNFKTNAPWINLKIVRNIPPGGYAGWNYNHNRKIVKGVSFHEDGNVATVEGTPGMIRRWFSNDPFSLVHFFSGQTSSISLALSASNHQPPINATVHINICEESLELPTLSTVMQFLWQSALFKLFNTFLVIFASVYGLNRQHHNRVHGRLRQTLAELEIPAEHHDALTKQLLAKRLYTFFGKTTPIPRIGAPVQTAQEEARALLEKFDLSEQLAAVREDAELEAFLEKLSVEQRPLAVQIIRAALDDFTQFHTIGRSLAAHLKNQHMQRRETLQGALIDFINQNKFDDKNKYSKLRTRLLFQLQAALLLDQPSYHFLRAHLRLSGHPQSLYRGARSLEELKVFRTQVQEGNINIPQELADNHDLLDSLNGLIEMRRPEYFNVLKKSVNEIDYRTYLQLFDLFLEENEYRFKLEHPVSPQLGMKR